MYDPKYISFDEDGIYRIIVFPSSINHIDMMQRLGVDRSRIIGAGLVSFEGKRCYGESVTLGIRVHENDTTFLRIHYNLDAD